MLRPTRLAAAVLTVAAATSLTTSTASAGSPGGDGSAATRTITITAVEPRDDVFVAKGTVDPAYADRIAIMQRKLRREKSWSTWRKFRTTDASRYRRRIDPLRRPGVVCYRVRVKASDGYDDSSSSRVCIRTYRA